MKSLSAIALLFLCSTLMAQGVEPWMNSDIYTANKATYLSESEKEMIAEINRVRTNPKAYVKFLQHYLDEARAMLKEQGKGPRSYSTQTTYSNGKVKKVDKIYHYQNEEELKAIESLISDLNNMEPLNALLPSRGIHTALKKHERDQVPTGGIDHLGTDGTWPNERIQKFAPSMQAGNENIVGGKGTVRYLVILLLIDSGISGYGHRYNMLDSRWTHVSCLEVGDLDTDDYPMDYWIQNFGMIGEK